MLLLSALQVQASMIVDEYGDDLGDDGSGSGSGSGSGEEPSTATSSSSSTSSTTTTMTPLEHSSTSTTTTTYTESQSTTGTAGSQPRLQRWAIDAGFRRIFMQFNAPVDLSSVDATKVSLYKVWNKKSKS